MIPPPESDMSRIRKLAKAVLPASATRRIAAIMRRGKPAPSPRVSPIVDVAPLIDALWAAGDGKSRLELEGVVRRVSDPEERATGLLALGKWEMTRGAWSTALEYFDEVAATSSGLAAEAISLGVDCCLFLEQPRQAMSRISVLLDRRRPDASTELRLGAIRAQGGDLDPLVASLNRIYLDRGLAPLHRRDPRIPTVWGNLTAAAPRFEPAENAFLVSVVIVARENDTFLRETILSLGEQTWPELEIVAVTTAPIDLDPTRRLVRVDGRGVDDPHVAGVAAASGRAVLFHGPNEWSHPQRVELQVASLGDRRPITGIHGIDVDASGALKAEPMLGAELINPLKSSLAWLASEALPPDPETARFLAPGAPMAVVLTGTEPVGKAVP